MVSEADQTVHDAGLIPAEGDRLTVTYTSVHGGTQQQTSGRVASVDASVWDPEETLTDIDAVCYRIRFIPDETPERAPMYQDEVVTRELVVTAFESGEPSAMLCAKNGGRWHRLSTRDPTWEHAAVEQEAADA